MRHIHRHLVAAGALAIVLVLALTPTESHADVFAATVGGELHSSYDQRNGDAHFGYLSLGVHGRFSRFYFDVDTPMVFLLTDGILGAAGYLLSRRGSHRFPLMEALNGEVDTFPYFRAMSLRVGGTPWRDENLRLEVGLQSALFLADRPIHDDHLAFGAGAVGPAVGIGYDTDATYLRATTFAGTSFSNWGKWQPHAGVDLVGTHFLSDRFGVYGRADLRWQRMDFRSYEPPAYPLDTPDPRHYRVVDSALFGALQVGMIIAISRD